MVVIMKPGTEQADIRKLAAKFEAKNLKVGITQGVGCTILGLVGESGSGKSVTAMSVAGLLPPEAV